MTCVARSEISCSSWWNEWSHTTVTAISRNISNIERCDDPCIGNLCENGANCTADKDADDGYRCHCPIGYTGKRCENG